MNENKSMPLDRLSDAIDVLTWLSEQLVTVAEEPKAAAQQAILATIVNLTLTAYASAVSKQESHQDALLKAVRGDMPIPPHVLTSVALQMKIAMNDELKNEPPAA